MNLAFFAVAVLIGVVLILCAVLVIMGTLLNAARKEAKEAMTEAMQHAALVMKQKEAELRKDAIARSKRVIIGTTYEKLVPFEKDFPFNPRDMRFLGNPIDYVVFDGLSEDALDRIVFLEIKTGKSRLTKRQRMIAQVVREGEVGYMTYRSKEETNEVAEPDDLP